MKTGDDSNFGAQSKLLKEKFVNIIAVRSLEFAEVMKQLGRIEKLWSNKRAHWKYTNRKLISNIIIILSAKCQVTQQASSNY